MLWLCVCSRSRSSSGDSCVLVTARRCTFVAARWKHRGPGLMGGTFPRWLGCGTILSAVFVRFPSSPVLMVFSSLCVAAEKHGVAAMSAIQIT